MLKFYYTEEEIKEINRKGLSTCAHTYKLEPVLDPFEPGCPKIFVSSEHSGLCYALPCIVCGEIILILISEYKRLKEEENE